MKLTLGPSEYILLANLNPSAFPPAIRDDPKHFRFVKPNAIRPGYEVDDGCRQLVMFKTSPEQNDILRVAAPGVGQRFVKSNAAAVEFLTTVVAQAYGDTPESPPPDSPAQPQPPASDEPHFGGQSSGVDFDAAARAEPTDPPTSPSDPRPPDAPPPDIPPPAGEHPPKTLEEFTKLHLADIAGLSEYAAGKKLTRLAAKAGFHGCMPSYYAIIRELRGRPLPSRTPHRNNRPLSKQASAAVNLEPGLDSEVEAIMALNREAAARLEKILPQIKAALAAADSLKHLRSRVTALESANLEMSGRLAWYREEHRRLAEE